jgi:hypothetical protein
MEPVVPKTADAAVADDGLNGGSCSMEDGCVTCSA